jgi:lathosterol oxidase
MYDCTKEQVFSSPLVAFFQYYILDMNGGKIYYNINDYGYLYLLISPLIWLLTIDTLTYWIHRTLHCPPFYKPIHHLHHTYYPVTTFTATGATVGEAIILGVIPLNLLFLIYPFHINFYYFVFIYQLIWFTTSHIDISYNAPGILISPHDHNMHHKYINKNFGVHTSMWDIICGTIYRPKMES